MWRFVALIILFAGLLALQTGCNSSAASTDGDQVVTVFAAASLADVFMDIAGQFEAANPGVKVILNFAGSQQLAHQISQGAPVDVFASADRSQMTAAISTGRIGAESSRIFARNRLVVVYPANNPAGLRELSDLSQGGHRLILAAPEVPAGQYALAFLERAALDPSLGQAFKVGLLNNIASYEENVRVVLSKVELGEADAGIVYRSDTYLLGPDDIGQIEIPEHLNVVASYTIAPIGDSNRPQLARRFIDYVLSPSGQDTLDHYGFDKMTEMD